MTQMHKQVVALILPNVGYETSTVPFLQESPGEAELLEVQGQPLLEQSLPIKGCLEA